MTFKFYFEELLTKNVINLKRLGVEEKYITEESLSISQSVKFDFETLHV